MKTFDIYFAGKFVGKVKGVETADAAVAHYIERHPNLSGGTVTACDVNAMWEVWKAALDGSLVGAPAAALPRRPLLGNLGNLDELRHLLDAGAQVQQAEIVGDMQVRLDLAGAAPRNYFIRYSTSLAKLLREYGFHQL